MEVFETMQRCPIFQNLTDNEIKALNFCFKTRVKDVKKGEDIASEGEVFDSVILFLSGKARTVETDFLGNESIIASYNFGDVYGLEDAFSNRQTFSHRLVATESCKVLLINRYRLVKCCENNCIRHQKVISNCVHIIAQQNLGLLEKLSQLSRRSTRAKVLAYLQSVSRKSRKIYFDIPYNRQELADYLSVDRSALS